MVGLNVKINGKALKFQADQITAETTEQLLKELAEEPDGPLKLTVTELSDWPEGPQRALWSLWNATRPRRTLKLRMGGKGYDRPFALALAQLKKDGGPDAIGRRLKAAAVVIANCHSPEGQVVCIQEVLARLKSLEIPGYTSKKIEQMIKASGSGVGEPARSSPGGPNPTLLAADFLKRFGLTVTHPTSSPDARLVHYHNGTFYTWDRAWRPVGPDEMRARVVSDAQGHSAAAAITSRLVGDILLNLQGLCAVGLGDESLPFYVEGYGPPTHVRRRKLLTLQNGMLDLEELAAGKKPELIAFDPRWFATTILPFAFDPEAKCPKFRKFLRRVLERNPRTGVALQAGDCRLEVLQEWLGYTLLCDGRYQKFLLMLGQGSNGKGVIQNLWIRMLGDANVSHVSLDQFGESFGLQPLLGKLANICGDLNEIDAVAEGNLKRLTGQDNMTVNIKNRPHVTLAPAVKLVFATNSLPRFKDRSLGVWRRLMAMPFRVVIPDDEQDETLVGTLEAELPGILNWALRGLRRLLEQRQFTHCDVCAATAARHRVACDPIAQFIDECSLLPPKNGEQIYRVGKDLLYTRYKEWSEKNGYKPFAKNNFGEAIAKLPGVIERRQNAGPDGKRPRDWYGVGDPYTLPIPDDDPGEDDE